MEENIQNNSNNEDYLQLTLLPVGTLVSSSVLTIGQEKLKKLGLTNHVISGVTWTNSGNPISCGLFTIDRGNYILNKIKTILNAAIVNAEQRKAVMDLIDHVVWDEQYRSAHNILSEAQNIIEKGKLQSSEDGIRLSTREY